MGFGLLFLFGLGRWGRKSVAPHVKPGSGLLKHRFSAKVLLYLQKPAQASAIDGVLIAAQEVAAATFPKTLESLQGYPFGKTFAQRIVDIVETWMMDGLPGVAIFVGQDRHRLTTGQLRTQADDPIVVETLHAIAIEQSPRLHQSQGEFLWDSHALAQGAYQSLDNPFQHDLSPRLADRFAAVATWGKALILRAIAARTGARGLGWSQLNLDGPGQATHREQNEQQERT